MMETEEFTVAQRRAGFWITVGVVFAGSIAAGALYGAMSENDAHSGAVVGAFGGMLLGIAAGHATLAVMPGTSLHCPMAHPST